MSGQRGEVDKTGMRPRVGQDTLTLPVTFDYSGGRKDKNKSAYTWSIVLGVLYIIFIIVMLFNKNYRFLEKVAISSIVLLVVSTIVRFFLLKEGKHREERIKLKDSKGVIDFKSMWGIYEISDYYPYICRFRSGKSGVFVLLNKDVILGKFVEAEFEHYEAIGDGYNIGGSSNIQMCHLDYMDIVGADERLDESFKSLSKVSNPDLKDLLTDIYTYQQELMSKLVTSFDAYVFLWSGNDEPAWNTICRILSCFMEANYRSYHVLNKVDIKELSKTIFLLEDFSAEQSMLNAFVSEKSRGIIPIKVEHYDGSVEVLNKTTKEVKEELEMKEKLEELKKEEMRRRRKGKSNNSLSEDEEIDLFE